MDFALGELGLRPDRFWALTWEEYQHACRHYDRRQEAQQQREIAKWQRTRQLGEWMAAFNGVDLKKELKGRRLLDLPGDAKAPAVDIAGLKEYRDKLSAEQIAKKSKPAQP